MTTTRRRLVCAGTLLVLALAAPFAGPVFAHGVSEGDRSLIGQGLQIGMFTYLGAKHMVTGYDHLLFLLGVIFFLRHMREVALYVTLFALGHSATLLYGVLSGTSVNAYAVDAVIGLSVVYKGFDNLGGWRRLFGFQPDTKAAVLIFGLIHGFGLATKLQEFSLSREGLVPNIVSFNVGVEIGQILALGAILAAMSFWRRSPSFNRFAYGANVALMTAGFILFGYQIYGYFNGGVSAP